MIPGSRFVPTRTLPIAGRAPPPCSSSLSICRFDFGVKKTARAGVPYAAEASGRDGDAETR